MNRMDFETYENYEKIIKEIKENQMKTLIIKELTNKKTNKTFYNVGYMTREGYKPLVLVDRIKIKERKENK